MNNLTIQDFLAFVVDWTPPRALNLTLTKTGENLYLPDPQTNPPSIWHGPLSVGNMLLVSVTVNDENPTLEVPSEVAGVGFVTFPDVFTVGDSEEVTANGAVADTQVQFSYTATGSADPAGNPLLTATDRAGNVSPRGSDPQALFTVLWDALAPTLSNFLLTLETIQHVYRVPNTHTVYYGPTATGTLKLRLNPTDGGAGMRHVAFPALFEISGFDMPPPPNGSPTYGRTYPIVGSTLTNLTTSLIAKDRVGNPALSPAFSVFKDDLAPTITLDVTPSDLFHYEISWIIAEEGSGLLSKTVQVCVDAAPCQTLVSNPAASGTFAFTADPEHSYTFRVAAVDRVDNAAEKLSEAFSTSSVTKYYVFGGQRVAMRRGSAVYYLHGDHLGSVSMSTDANGNLVSQMRFTPFGEEITWEGSGESPTDFGFTSQCNERGFGLMDYNARFYSSSLGRFVSADSIIPGGFNPMAFDRYTYVFNSPLNFVDPSGNVACEAVGECESGDGDFDPTITLEDIAEPEIDWDLLTENGKAAWEVYLKLWRAKDEWWWSDPWLGGDGTFSVEDFVTMILYIEMDVFWEEAVSSTALTEAMVRSFYEWGQEMERLHPGEFATSPTPEGLLNWIFKQTGANTRTDVSDFDGNTPRDMAVPIAFSMVKAIINPSQLRQPQWAEGWAADRPFAMGSHTPDTHYTLPYITAFVAAGCPSYYMRGDCSLESNFAFILTGAERNSYP